MTERKIMEREIKRFPIIGLDFSSRILKNFQFFGHRNYELDEKFLCLKKSGNSKFSSGISRTSFPKNLTQSRERCIVWKIGLALFVALVLPLVAADEYSLYCLDAGEQLDFGVLCNPAMGVLTGPTSVCVHILDNGKICPGGPLNNCYDLGLTCGATSNTTVDSTPPELEIFSPIEGEIYSERMILLNLDVNERVNVQYKDNNDPSRRWKNVCSDCSSYSRERSFKEGLNDLTFRVTDEVGNEAFLDLSFRIDSKDPKIKNTAPTDGFASGEFFVEVEEDNLVSLKLIYGIAGDIRMKNVDLENECIFDRSWECTTNADLSDFDGNEISYYFEAMDIAGTSDMSDNEFLMVDYSDPVIIDFNYTKNGKFVTFMIEVDEPNFKEIVYIDDLENRPKQKKLCSKLINRQCEKKVSFKDGDHSLRIIVSDQAGHLTEQNVDIVTDSKIPKIKEINPSRGFVSGFFEVEFDETNPEQALFRYGNLVSGFFDYEIGIENECILNRNYVCSFDVNVGEYNDEEIEARLIVLDKVGNIGEDGKSGLKVDILPPEILSLDYTVNGGRTEVIIGVDENNLEEITYRNNGDSNPIEKSFCSKLTNGMCKKKLRLNEGTNPIDFMIFDEAGNAVAESLEIVL